MNDQVEIFFVGVGKCGTTWIYETTKRLKLLSVPTLKEPFIVDQPPSDQTKLVTKLYDQGVMAPLADFSNLYFTDIDNAKKIFDYNSEAKIILTVRKPSDRIASQYQMLVRNGLDETISLSEYLDNDDLGLIERSRYWDIAQRYIDVFGKEKVQIMSLEMLKSRPQAYMDRLCSFLEISSPALSVEDRKPVLVASKPRNAAIARQGKKLSLYMRRVGLYKSLGYLKNSNLVRGLVYKPIDKREIPDFGKFSSEVLELDQKYDDFLVDHKSAMS